MFKKQNNKIKLSDYVIQFIENLGVKHVFLISGGGVIHIIDSVGKSRKIKFVCNHHEQACTMAAEAYSRVTDNIGVCIVTSGPGGTNTITGVLSAWLDSIPILVISGQIKRETMGAGAKLRQLGDQEINIVDIVKPITKYAVTVMEPLDIRYHLEKAVHLAKSGRPGPVWIDIPLDIQGSLINIEDLKKFNSLEVKPTYETDKRILKKGVTKTINELKSSKRPVLFVGNGVRLSHASKELLKLVNLMKIPVLTSFTAYDLVGCDNKFYFGRPGTVGQRAANFIIQNSDFLLILGSRLNIRMLSYNYKSFAREAYKIMVDIDKEELRKKTVHPDLALNFDAKDFILEMLSQLKEKVLNLEINDWLERCRLWNDRYPTVLPKYWQEKKFVNPYCFVDTLSKYLKTNDVMALANGSACVCPYQALKFPQGMRVVVNSGCASMGYGLPAAIGACFARNKNNTICIEGDGSIQLNIQELQTIVHHKLPIKLFILNNEGYLSIRLTQNNLFKGKYVASDAKSGVSCPDFIKIAKAYGIKTEKISNNGELNRKIKKTLSYSGPIICEVVVSPTQQFIPKVTSKKMPDGSFVSKPLEDMYPFLSRKELKENMLIKLLGEK